MKNMVNTTFNSITRAKISTITPVLILALSAGIAAPVIAQDDPGAFGLLDAFDQQEEVLSDEGSGFDDVEEMGEPEFNDGDIEGLSG